MLVNWGSSLCIEIKRQPSENVRQYGEQPRGRKEWCEGALVGGVELV